MDNLTKQWKSLVDMNLSRISSLPMAQHNSLPESIYFYTTNIFSILIKLKNQSFYTKKEIETIFLLTKRDITDLNDCLALIIADDSNSLVPLLVYYIIADTFTDLIDLMECYESYEGAKNLLDYQTYWFNLMSVKIPKPNVK